MVASIYIKGAGCQTKILLRIFPNDIDLAVFCVSNRIAIRSAI